MSAKHKMPSLMSNGTGATSYWTDEEAAAYYARCFPYFPKLQQTRIKNKKKVQEKAGKIADALIKKYGEPNAPYTTPKKTTAKITSREQLVQAIYWHMMDLQYKDDDYKQAREVLRKTYEAIEKVDAAIAELEKKSRKAYKDVSVNDFKPLADDETEK